MGVVREKNASYVSAFFTGGKKAGSQKKKRTQRAVRLCLANGEKTAGERR